MSVSRRSDRRGWWVRLEVGGREIQRYGGRLKRHALDLEARLKIELTPRPKCDLNRFVEEIYWPSQLNHLSTRAMQREEGILNNHIGPFFAGEMAAISPQLILKFIGHRKATGASGDSIRKELGILRHILRRALKLDLLSKDPFEKLERRDIPPPSPARTRYLTLEEWEKLLFQIPERYLTILVFLINTGCRRGEALRLEWSDIDLIAGIARARKDKRGKPKNIQLAPFLIEMLRKLPRLEGEPRVFWDIKWAESLSRVFKKTCQRAGILNCRLHDLRHSFASQLAMHGVDLRTIQDLLGHEDSRMTARYAHLSQEHLEKAIQAMDGVYKGRVN